MKRTKAYTAIAALAAALALLVSACGGSGNSGAMGVDNGAPNANEQVSVSDVDGVGNVLVDSKGDALYMSEQEAGGMVLCTDGCTAFWKPLLVQGSGTPAGASSVDGKLGTVERPDGVHQITFDGAPLYRFTEGSDHGVVSGDGFADSFDGRQFTWHVARPGGATEAPSTPSGGIGY